MPTPINPFMAVLPPRRKAPDGRMAVHHRIVVHRAKDTFDVDYGDSTTSGPKLRQRRPSPRSSSSRSSSSSSGSATSRSGSGSPTADGSQSEYDVISNYPATSRSESPNTDRGTPRHRAPAIRHQDVGLGQDSSEGLYHYNGPQRMLVPRRLATWMWEHGLCPAPRAKVAFGSSVHAASAHLGPDEDKIARRVRTGSVAQTDVSRRHVAQLEQRNQVALSQSVLEALCHGGGVCALAMRFTGTSSEDLLPTRFNGQVVLSPSTSKSKYAANFDARRPESQEGTGGSADAALPDMAATVEAQTLNWQAVMKALKAWRLPGSGRAPAPPVQAVQGVLQDEHRHAALCLTGDVRAALRTIEALRRGSVECTAAVSSLRRSAADGGPALSPAVANGPFAGPVTDVGRTVMKSKPSPSAAPATPRGVSQGQRHKRQRSEAVASPQVARPLAGWGDDEEDEPAPAPDSVPRSERRQERARERAHRKRMSEELTALGIDDFTSPKASEQRSVPRALRKFDRTAVAESEVNIIAGSRRCKATANGSPTTEDALSPKRRDASQVLREARAVEHDHGLTAEERARQQRRQRLKALRSVPMQAAIIATNSQQASPGKPPSLTPLRRVDTESRLLGETASTLAKKQSKRMPSSSPGPPESPARKPLRATKGSDGKGSNRPPPRLQPVRGKAAGDKTPHPPHHITPARRGPQSPTDADPAALAAQVERLTAALDEQRQQEQRWAARVDAQQRHLDEWRGYAVAAATALRAPPPATQAIPGAKVYSLTPEPIPLGFSDGIGRRVPNSAAPSPLPLPRPRSSGDHAKAKAGMAVIPSQHPMAAPHNPKPHFGPQDGATSSPSAKGQDLPPLAGGEWTPVKLRDASPGAQAEAGVPEAPPVWERRPADTPTRTAGVFREPSLFASPSDATQPPDPTDDPVMESNSGGGNGGPRLSAFVRRYNDSDDDVEDSDGDVDARQTRDTDGGRSGPKVRSVETTTAVERLLRHDAAAVPLGSAALLPPSGDWGPLSVLALRTALQGVLEDSVLGLARTPDALGRIDVDLRAAVVARRWYNRWLRATLLRTKAGVAAERADVEADFGPAMRRVQQQGGGPRNARTAEALAALDVVRHRRVCVAALAAKRLMRQYHIAVAVTCLRRWHTHHLVVRDARPVVPRLPMIITPRGVRPTLPPGSPHGPLDDYHLDTDGPDPSPGNGTPRYECPYCRSSEGITAASTWCFTCGEFLPTKDPLGAAPDVQRWRINVEYDRMDLVSKFAAAAPVVARACTIVQAAMRCRWSRRLAHHVVPARRYMARASAVSVLTTAVWVALAAVRLRRSTAQRHPRRALSIAYHDATVSDGLLSPRCTAPAACSATVAALRLRLHALRNYGTTSEAVFRMSQTTSSLSDALGASTIDDGESGEPVLRLVDRDVVATAHDRWLCPQCRGDGVAFALRTEEKSTALSQLRGAASALLFIAKVSRMPWAVKWRDTRRHERAAVYGTLPTTITRHR